MSDVSVRVWGREACFTRPEFKVERLSYEIPTPSAARGILEAIFWHYPLQWHIDRIEVLKLGRWMSFKRNEVNYKASASVPYLDVSDDDMRAQRNTLLLKDVAYVIHANVAVPPNAIAPEERDNIPGKYIDQFNHRVERGQCFSQPAFGCKECVAFFGPPIPGEKPVKDTVEFDRTLFDIKYGNGGRREAIFYQPRMEKGVIQVPQELYANVWPEVGGRA